jgi:hypothetical protein
MTKYQLRQLQLIGVVAGDPDYLHCEALVFNPYPQPNLVNVCAMPATHVI